MNRSWHLFTCSALSLLALYGAPGRLSAQPILERLEKQIRQRVGKGTDHEGASSQRDRMPPAQTSIRSIPPRESGYLGVLADDKEDRGRGVRILDVYAGGPAEKAGLRKQDLVTQVESLRVRQLSELAEVLALYAPGETVEFVLQRDAKPKKLQVTLGERPRKKTAPGAQPERIPTPQAEAAPIQPPPARTSEFRSTVKPVGPSLELPPEPKLPGEQAVAEPSAPPDLILPPLPEKPSAARQTEIEKLQRRVQELEQRVEALERELAKWRKK